MLALVVCGGALGAIARYLIDRPSRVRWPLGPPRGILICNLVGSFLLGMFTGAALSPAWSALFGVGFCGALTTYSTFSYDTLLLLQRGEALHASRNVFVTLVGGVGLAAVGISVGALLVS